MLAVHPYGFLVSVGSGGPPHARLVAHAGVDSDLSTWIGTSPASRKIAEIEWAGQATYAVEDRTSFASLAMNGKATIVSDVETRVTDATKHRLTMEYKLPHCVGLSSM